MPDGESKGPYVFYVKAWRSERDFSKGRSPEVHYIYHTGEKAAIEVNMNVRVAYDSVNELKVNVLRRFRKLEYGMALPEEWERAVASHLKEYGKGLSDQGRIGELKVVVRGGAGGGRWGRSR